MWKFLEMILCMCFLFSGNCFAMEFSQPVEIGKLGIMQAGGGGVYVEGADYNSGKFYTKYRRDNTHGYEKGVARFGNEEDALYVHYSYGEYLRLGGKDIKNTIDDNILISTIYRIKSDEGITLYSIYKTYGPEADYFIIGRRADGRFIKYIDTEEITKRYFGWDGIGASPIVYLDMYTQDDTLVIEYQRYGNKQFIKGTFYFKWDDNAQWFGVEQGTETVIRSW